MESLVYSWCLRNKVKLACDLQSLSRNVILHVLFSTAVIDLVPIHLFWGGGGGGAGGVGANRVY